MAAVRAQVILHTNDAFPANYVTNSLCFGGSDPIGDHTAITAAIRTFYGALGASNLSNSIATTGHEVKYYDLPGVKPNYPVIEDTFALPAAPSGSPLPSEVAICISFHGPRTPGFPQARRRGRIYIGPLGSGANTSGRPSAGTITAFTVAATAFKTAIAALPSDTTWAVWSTVDQTAVDISAGWVDNAFDVQRRRGIEETSRTTWS